MRAGIAAFLFFCALVAAPTLQAQTPPDETQRMFDAVLRDDLAAVKRHVDAGADVSWRNPRGLTAAEIAVEIGHIEIANYLLTEEKARASRPARTVAEKGAAKTAKKSAPTAAAAKKQEKQEAAPAAETPPTRTQRGPRTVLERLAGLMRPDADEPEAAPESPAPGTSPAATAETPADRPAQDAQPADELSPAERIAARVRERQEAERKSLPEPRAAEEKRAQRPRTFLEWLTDNLTGREPRDTSRPRLADGLSTPPAEDLARLQPPPSDRPTPGVRDPWAPLVAPATPSIVPAPTTTEPPTPPAVASAPPPPAEAPTRPSETAPAPWAAAVERGGTPEVAAVPEAPAAEKPRDAPTLFASRKDGPPSKKGGEPKGGLSGTAEKQSPQLGAPKQAPAPAAPGGKPAEGGGLWGSTVEMAQARPMVTAPPSAPPVPEAVPTGLGFMVGRSLNLDKDVPPRGENQDSTPGCIEKSRGAVVFCVEVANWPQAMEADFSVNTILYTGQQAVVRYDRSRASRMQTLFPSDSFDKVVAYYAGLYGPPAEYWTRSIAPLASARRENPTRVWRARNPKTGQIATLEIRKFDDTRGGFPDTRRGVVMLYYQDTPPIFPQVSALELMRLKRPHIPSPDAEGAGAGEPPQGGLFGTAPPGPGAAATRTQ